MIEITDSPSLISFAGNPVIFGACSSDYLVSSGNNASFEMIVSGIDTVEGHSFTLNFAGKTLVFQSSGFPAFDGLLFGVAIYGQTFNDFADNICQCFLQNYDIQKSYNVTLGPAGIADRKITLLAKAPGPDYTVTMTGNGVNGLAVGTSVPGTGDVYRDFFSILCLVRDAYGHTIGEDLKSTDFIGGASFEISDYLRSKFATWELPRFEFPELDGNVKVHGWDYLLKYRVSFTESIAGHAKGLMSGSWHYALAGGLSHELMTCLNGKFQDYFSIEANRFRFLTWLPATKHSRSGVTEKLFFLFQDNPEGVQYRLVVIVNFTDGNHRVINATQLAAWESYSVAEFKVGFDHLDLVNAAYGKTVKSWEVVLMDSNDDNISERRTFINDSRVFDNEKVFLYRNSFSAYDTFRFLGKSELSLEYERTAGITIREENYSFFNAPSRQFNTKESEACKANSGWISLQEKNCLRELLLSNEVYEQAGKELFQIVVRSAKITPFLKDGEYLYNLEIEYERAYHNSFFSLHTPDSSARPVIPPQLLSWDNAEVSFDDMEISFDQVTY